MVGDDFAVRHHEFVQTAKAVEVVLGGVAGRGAAAPGRITWHGSGEDDRFFDDFAQTAVFAHFGAGLVLDEFDTAGLVEGAVGVGAVGVDDIGLERGRPRPHAGSRPAVYFWCNNYAIHCRQIQMHMPRRARHGVGVSRMERRGIQKVLS
ncbi:MAG TPA: hypothetical protein PLU16_10545 [Gallionellaceae bacterium]|nr:hypothetical protein [Gallionellaceae bacterium]HQS75642.1 hypothetical protein [Gallionellaceae bacterium]